MDKASVLGISIGILAILGAFLLESGSPAIILNFSAALIVIGGSFGATLINFSLPAFVNAVKSAKKVFIEEDENAIQVIEQIITLANLARHNGILALQDVVESIEDKFLRRGVQLIVDTSNPQLVYEILTTEINLEEEQELVSARIFEAIGGFAPTFGIIGAVMGLINVMSKLDNPSQLGAGIATSFVSTLYGVGLANLIFLPIAGKLKNKLRDQMIIKDMIVQGLVSIQIGENPAILEEKLFTFLNYAQKQSSCLVEYKGEEELI